jgi:trans-aconitate methyltransferase
MDRKSHWENVYQTKDTTKVSWYQDDESLSLKLIQKYTNPNDSIIDIGCGDSKLIDNLVAYGYKNLAALDISQLALDKMQSRLQDKISYICCDINSFKPQQKYNLWHDRAVLHFLTSTQDIQIYKQNLVQTLLPNGVAIIATFAPDKVRECSNLSTKAYDENLILELLGSEFKLKQILSENHITPSGDKQLFNYFVLQKKY